MARPKTGSPKGGKKGDKKWGRNKKKPAYQRYLFNDGRAKRKALKIFRYMKKFPNWKPIITERIKPHLNKLLRSG